MANKSLLYHNLLITKSLNKPTARTMESAYMELI